MDQSDCEKLLEEYQMLVQQLEESEVEIDVGNDEKSIEDYSVEDFGDEFTQEDYERLAELERLLEEECGALPEDESELDLPEYANQAPSEPINRDGEGLSEEDAEGRAGV